MGNARGRTCLPGRIGLDAWPNQPLRHFIRRRYQRNISRPFQRQVSSRRRPFANQAATKKPRQSQASVSVLRPYLRGGVTCGLAGCSSVTWTHASRTLVGQQLVRCFSKTAGLARARCTVPAAPLADDASVGVQLLTLLCFYTAPRPAVITKMRESQRSYPYHLFHQSYAPIIRAAAHADAPPYMAQCGSEPTDHAPELPLPTGGNTPQNSAGNTAPDTRITALHEQGYAPEQHSNTQYEGCTDICHDFITPLRLLILHPAGQTRLPRQRRPHPDH